MIYIAAPYTHTNSKIVLQRVRRVNAYAAELMRDGFIVFSPITMCHPLVKYGLSGNWSYWKKQDEFFLKGCEYVHVLMLDGWKESTGIKAEVKMALKLKKSIMYIRGGGVV